jgi:hypothetical protein
MLYFLKKMKKIVVFACFFTFFIFFFCLVRAQGADIVVVDTAADKPYPFDILKINTWQSFEKGLQFIRIEETILTDRGEENNQKVPLTLNFDVLKFDPAFFDFSVYGVMTDKTESKVLSDWIRNYDLQAVINASMYLMDNKTSIGYLRKGSAYVNKHRGKSLGAFFVSHPYEEYQGQIPSCAILYENDPDLHMFFSAEETKQTLENVLKKYSVVVQNFKLVDLPAGKSEWKGQRRHAIAAVAQDRENNILLMYASKPLTIQEFRTVLQNNPLLKIKRAMYTEGGVEAGMAYKGKHLYLWQHEENIMLFLKGSVKLPNVIGITRKHACPF